MLNLEKTSLNHQKPQNFIGSKFPQKMHEKGMKLENKCKRKGERVLPALEEKNLAKELEENDKKFDLSLDRSNRERVCLKTF